MLNQKKTTIDGDIPVFLYDKTLTNALGGFTLNTAGLTPGDKIPQGTAFVFDELNRTATPLKSATVVEDVADGSAVLKVAKGSALKAGDNVTANGKFAKVSSVSKTDPNFDSVTLDKSVGALTAGNRQGVAESDNGAAKSFNGNVGLLYNAVTVPDADGVASVSLMLGGTVYARRIPYVSDAIKAALPRVIFSQSK